MQDSILASNDQRQRQGRAIECLSQPVRTIERVTNVLWRIRKLFGLRPRGGISWIRQWTNVLDDSTAPFYRWFKGGVLNTCYNCLDRHVESGWGGQITLIYDSPLAGVVKKFSYAELLNLVSRFAGVLTELGVGKGQRVLIYMPMVPEAAVAMLACARIGAVHSVVFGGFAPNELVKRINDAEPKVVVSASCGIEPQRIVPYKPLLDEAIALAGCKPEHCVILQRPQLKATMVPERDLDWQGLRGCTTILYEGKPVGTPDAGACWRVISQHRVRSFFTAPTAFRAIKRDDPQGEWVRGYDLSDFRALFLAGER